MSGRREEREYHGEVYVVEVPTPPQTVGPDQYERAYREAYDAGWYGSRYSQDRARGGYRD